MVEIQNAAASCIFNLVCKSDKEELEALGAYAHAHMLAHARICTRGRWSRSLYVWCRRRSVASCVSFGLMLGHGAGCNAVWLFATPFGCLRSCHLVLPAQRALDSFCSGALPVPILAHDCLPLIRDPADAAEHQEHSTHDRHATPVRHKQPQRGRLSSLWNILSDNRWWQLAI